MKLKELHINNFKFFPKQDAKSPLLRIDEKNLLIYGENGSGKSTIYWALYTLLESSFKKTDNDVAKYFEYRGLNGLVNIHASRLRHNTFIKAVLKDGATTKDYLISGNLPVIQAIRADSAVRESGMASEFINYKILHGLHQARNSVENNLFDWFAHEILPYIRTQSTSTFEEVFNELRKGPRKVQDLAGDTIFAHATLRTDPDAGMQSNFRFYRVWDNKVQRWKNEFTIFIRKINTRANQILQNDFQQNIEFKLEFTPPRYNVIGTPIISPDDLTNLNWHEPQIIIKIVRYRGTPNAVKKEHSFLNEAKWTAIGLSIRLAILEDVTYRPSPVDLKCLVMDDMLLSLDMSNRDIVLNLLLDRYVNDYQLILMTHDRYFFELAKGKINARNAGNNWLKLEMYEDEVSNRLQPLILDSKTNLGKAKAFFKQKEFAASANHMRKATECFVYEFVPKSHHYDRNFKELNLSQLINKSRALARLAGWPANVISELDLMRTNVFNPGSHYDVYTPVFQTDLKRAIETLDQVCVHATINL